jgi:Uma2 family endonuclease
MHAGHGQRRQGLELQAQDQQQAGQQAGRAHGRQGSGVDEVSLGYARSGAKPEFAKEFAREFARKNQPAAGGPAPSDGPAPACSPMEMGARFLRGRFGAGEAGSNAMSGIRVLEHYTLDDYRLWEGDWELIRGVPLAMTPSPDVAHQRLGGRLFIQLAEALDSCPACEVLYEIDVEFSQDTVTRPDVLVMCDPLRETRITRAPALIAEVISPKTARRDERTKFQLYRDEGVGYYLLLYPAQAKAKVYRLVDGDYRKVGDFQRETCTIELPRCVLHLDFSRLWPRAALTPEPGG